MGNHTSRAALAALAVVVAAPAAAHARGHVLRVDGADIFIDLGTEDGVGPGSVLTLHHAVTATHPVTRKKLRDTFALGALEVVNAGKHLCVARAADDELRRRVAVGDEIELSSEPRSFVDPWIEATRPVSRTRRPQRSAAAARAADQAAQKARQAALEGIAAEEAARAAWQRTLGRPPLERIEVWDEFLGAHPRSPYAAVIRTEVASLREQIRVDEELRSGAALDRAAVAALYRLGVAAGQDVTVAGPLATLPPRRVYEGRPLSIDFLILRPDQVRTAWLHYRRAGEVTYHSAELRRHGDGYLTLELPAAAVRPPAVEYFVEVLEPTAEAPRPLLGEPMRPVRVAVDASVEEPPPDVRGRSRVTVFLDYVDFDGFDRDFDQYLHAEIDFMYRVRRPIYSLRIGFGTLGGVGGPKDVIDASPQDCLADGVYRCRRVSYHYAYTELELRFHDLVALMVRPVLGSAYLDPRRDEGVDREFFEAFGLRTRLRLGREEATNLALGVAATQRLGTLFEAAFTWDVVPRFPIVLSAQVTDQPVPEDYGVRLIADVGWRGPSWVYPSLRLAYQARDLDHAGISGGVAANFDW